MGPEDGYIKEASLSPYGVWDSRTKISQDLSSAFIYQQIPKTKKRKDKEEGLRPRGRSFLWTHGLVG